jgi:MFS family permease
LLSPALGAFSLDISQERHRSQVMGIRRSTGALGGVLGPLLAAAAAGFIPPQSAFTGSVAVVLLGALLALVILREPRQPVEKTDVAWEISDNRIIASRASLRSIVLGATAARKQKDGP